MNRFFFINMVEQIKVFLRENKYAKIETDFHTKDRKIVKKMIELCNKVHILPYEIDFNCSSCSIRSRIEHGLEILNNYLQRKKEIMSTKNCNYHIKKGDISERVIFFNGSHYTNANLTDAVAEAMIKQNKANLKLFDVIPEPKVLIPVAEKDIDYSAFNDAEILTVAENKLIDVTPFIKKDGTFCKGGRIKLEKLLQS